MEERDSAETNNKCGPDHLFDKTGDFLFHDNPRLDRHCIEKISEIQKVL